MAADITYSRTKLHKLLVERFSEQELRTFCFHLNEEVDNDISYDNLEGEGKDAKARELVDYFVRRSRIKELAQAVKRERPDIDLSIAQISFENNIKANASTTSEFHYNKLSPYDLGSEHWRSWWLFCIVAPLVMLIVLWPFEKFWWNLDHAYARIFAEAEWILFSSLALLGISIQIRGSSKKLKSPFTYKWIARAGAIILLIFFNVLRHKMISLKFLMTSVDWTTLSSYAGFNLSITFASVAFCYFTHWNVKKSGNKTSLVQD
jgi:hypothetical protein